MGEVYFYHLTRSPLEAALAALLTRALASGWRVAVRGSDPARLGWLDEKLWLGPQEGFVPHGLVGGPHDPDQPVLLTTGTDLANGATCVMAIDGAVTTAAEVAALSRVCVLFDGNDPDAVAHARNQWSDLIAGGASAQYWSEAGGRWEKKAAR